MPVLYLASQLSKPTFYEFLKQAKITRLAKAETYGLSIALGSSEVTMEELVELYAMLANFGAHQQLKKILNIEKDPTYTKLLSPEASFVTLDILKDVTKPKINDNISSNSYTIPIYWKTGTSSSYKDSWAVGIFGKYVLYHCPLQMIHKNFADLGCSHEQNHAAETGPEIHMSDLKWEMVLAVWVGDFKGKSKGSFIGLKTAAPLFFNMIDAILIRDKNEDIIIGKAKNLNLIKVQACSDTGDINNEFCLNKTNSWFIPGKSPIKQTGIYRKIIVETNTGKQVCQFIDGHSEYKIISVWSSDLLELYKKAGIHKNNFSDILTKCDNIATDYGKLKIISPLKNVRYSIKRNNKITFSATADNNVKEIFWFINNELIGKSLPSEPLLRKARTGKFIVDAVDNNGSSDSVIVLIEY